MRASRPRHREIGEEPQRNRRGGWREELSSFRVPEVHEELARAIDVAERHRGTFAGLATPQVIEYVKSLGVTSVEFFDDQGELAVSFFGVRERGKPQPKSWTELTAALPQG